MKRIVFTFGTLYQDDIIEALLGKVPQNFYATLPDYAIFKGGFSQLPSKVKDFFSSRYVDPNLFSYLFVKRDTTNQISIEGRAYYINLEEELILDHWELYPDWYRKQAVTIRANDGIEHEAFIYTLDIDGEKLKEFKRVVNDAEKVIANAKETRRRVLYKFPKAFNK